MTNPSDRPLVTVVVSTYRRPTRVARLLEALAEQTLPVEMFEVVAVDNCSGDTTHHVLTQLAESVPYRLRVLQTSVNRGPAPARNLGWRSSKAPLLAFTDDDVVPEPRWLEAGLAGMADGHVGVAQGRTRPPDGTDRSTYNEWTHQQDIAGPTAQFEACNVFYRREAFEATGGFDEAIGWWGEDAAAGWSVIEAGWKRAFIADAVVVHDVEDRRIGWYLRNGLRESNIMGLAARHPGFRQTAFWRPWSLRRVDSAFKLAVVGAVVAVRWRPAALVALPYLWWQRPSVRHLSFFRRGFELVSVDAARCIGQVHGAIRHRILVF